MDKTTPKTSAEWAWLLREAAAEMDKCTDGDPALNREVAEAMRIGADAILGENREASCDYRIRLVKIAALAVAALEAFDRADVRENGPENG